MASSFQRDGLRTIGPTSARERLRAKVPTEFKARSKCYQEPSGEPGKGRSRKGPNGVEVMRDAALALGLCSAYDGSSHLSTGPSISS